MLLLTQNADDIPFDLKHHQHTVYEGSIDTLREKLVTRIKWAIEEAKNNASGRTADQFEVIANDVVLPSEPSSTEPPIVMNLRVGAINRISTMIRNTASAPSDPISHIYVFVEDNPSLHLYQLTIEGRYNIAPF